MPALTTVGVQTQRNSLTASVTVSKEHSEGGKEFDGGYQVNEYGLRSHQSGSFGLEKEDESKSSRCSRNGYVIMSGRRARMKHLVVARARGVHGCRGYLLLARIMILYKPGLRV